MESRMMSAGFEETGEQGEDSHAAAESPRGR